MAVALTVEEETTIQLSPQLVLDSRIPIATSTELSGDTMRSYGNGIVRHHQQEKTGSPQKLATFIPKELSLVCNGFAHSPHSQSQSQSPRLVNGFGSKGSIASVGTKALPDIPGVVLTKSSAPSVESTGDVSYQRTALEGKSFPNGEAVNRPNARGSSLPNQSLENGAPISTSPSPEGSGTRPSTSAIPPPTPIPSRVHDTALAASTSSTSNRSGSEVDLTAGLIQNLYARLDKQGVPGDGWQEGQERSRDGIINREVSEGASTSPTRDRKGKSVLVQRPTIDEQEEDKILKRVDRYGFFSSSHPAALASQHNRLATLDHASLSVLPLNNRLSRRSRIAPSNIRASMLPTEGSATSAIAKAIELRRIDKWARMLKVAKQDQGGNSLEWDLAPRWWDGRETGTGNYKTFQKRVFKGVPDRWRRAVWGLELERTAKEEQKRGKRQVKSLEELKQDYRRWVDLPSAQDVQIDLDVPRTISGHVLFHTRYGQGQRALFHVLHAFGLSCEDIGGYCQGMGPIAATLLNYFEPEQAYAALVRLFDQYHLRHVFEPGFTGLMETFYVQERMVEWLMPDVHQAFTNHMISTSAYATKWYITLFANSVPFATQLRLWDGLLLEGRDFLVIVAVAIIWCFKTGFTSSSASFESILSTLSSYFFVESDDAFLQWIRKTLRMKDVRKKMEGCRVEWQGFVKDGTADKRVT